MGWAANAEAVSLVADDVLDGVATADDLTASLVRLSADLPLVADSEAKAAAVALRRLRQRLDPDAPEHADARGALDGLIGQLEERARSGDVGVMVQQLAPRRVDAHLLLAVHRAPGTTPSDVVDFVWPTQPPAAAASMVSAAVTRLERMGLVVRGREGKTRPLRTTEFGRRVAAALPARAGFVSGKAQKRLVPMAAVRRLARAQLESDGMAQGLHLSSADRARVWMLSAASVCIDALARQASWSPSDLALANVLLSWPFFDHDDSLDDALFCDLQECFDSGPSWRWQLCRLILDFQRINSRSSLAASLVELAPGLREAHESERLIWSTMASAIAATQPRESRMALVGGTRELLADVQWPLAYHLRGAATHLGGFEHEVDPVLEWLQVRGAVRDGLGRRLDQQLALAVGVNVTIHRLTPLLEEVRLHAVTERQSDDAVVISLPSWVSAFQRVVAGSVAGRGAAEGVVDAAAAFRHENTWMRRAASISAAAYERPIAALLRGVRPRDGYVVVRVDTGLPDRMAWGAAQGVYERVQVRYAGRARWVPGTRR